MTVRRHIITGEPIVFAPERAARPHAFIGDDGQDLCPFCPGNEAQTPPEITRIADDGSWLVRVFPNKYPAVPDHEVIVESPRHDASFDQIDDASAVVAVYIDRYRAMQQRPDMQYVALFKNHGRAAGASIDHLHSQIAALPFVPPRIAEQIAAFSQTSSCPLCDAIEIHRREGLLIAESDAFAWLAPHGSTFAYEQWIVPKRHQRDMSDVSNSDTRELGTFLQRGAASMRRVSPAHNWLFFNFPQTPSAHWYAALFPRVTNVAGFELGTGTYIDVVDPVATVRLMR